MFYALGPLFLYTARPYLKVQQVRSIDYPYIQVEISLANITPVKGIGSSSFEIYENDWKVNSFHVRKIEPEKNPKKIILLVDSSKTLSKERFDTQLNAIRNFTKVLNGNDSIAILSYNNKVTNHCGFISEKLKMLDCIHRIRREGSKAVLRDAIFEGLKLSKGLSPERHAIILFTDGKEEGSVMEMSDIMNMLNQSSTPIFAVATGDPKKIRSISRIIRVSGGDIYHVNRIKDVSKIYLLINELLDNIYVIRYISQASATSLDGKKVKLLVRVSSPEFTEEETYTFFLHNFSLTSLWQKIKTDERYWLFGVVGFLFLLLIMGIIRRPRYIVQESGKASSKPDGRRSEEKLVGEGGGYDIQDYLDDEEPKTTEIITPVKKPEKRSSVRESPPKKTARGYLVEKEGPHTGRRYELNWENISIGYSDENSIAMDDPSVSYEHAKIKQKDGRFFLYDLLSENGTYLNGKKLLRPSLLRDFDEIQMGKTKLIFRKVFQSV